MANKKTAKMDKADNAGSKKVVKGSKVSLDYEGKLESGEVFDSSKHGDHSHPLEFEAGTGMVIAGFDAAVMGMKIGEEKEFSIEPKDAYGMHRAELTKEIPRDALPKEQEPKAGMTLVIGTPQGQFPVKIASVNEKTVVIDMNHPLAGKKLIFNIKVIGIDEKDFGTHNHQH
jgi:peptidylprolyl isomerase